MGGGEGGGVVGIHVRRGDKLFGIDGFQAHLIELSRCVTEGSEEYQ